MDVHEDIHRAMDAYHDAEEFRRCLNSTLQNARGVTWLLQKRKSRWTDFNEWYDEWVRRTAESPVLKWSVRSRNRIVKEEDLDTLSSASVSLYGPRLKEAEYLLDLPPYITVTEIVAAFSRAMAEDDVERAGTLRVTRRWVDSALPEHELIAALREVYDRVAQVIARAHGVGSTDTCGMPAFQRPCVTAHIDPGLRCIPPTVEGTSLLIDAATGEVYTHQYMSLERDDSMVDKLRARYGESPTFGLGPIGDIPSQIQMAKTMVAVDGFVGQKLLLFSGTEAVHFIPVQVVTGRPREIAIELAVESVGARYFDGAQFVTEGWLGKLDGSPSTEGVPTEAGVHYDPDPVGGRQEALMITALSVSDSVNVVVPFFREGSNVRFGEVSEHRGVGAIPMMLRPVVTKMRENYERRHGRTPGH